MAFIYVFVLFRVSFLAFLEVFPRLNIADPKNPRHMKRPWSFSLNSILVLNTVATNFPGNNPVYVNDLPDDVICDIAICADDTTRYSKCDQASDLWQQLELDSELESDL